MQKLKFLAALPIVGILVLAFSCSTSQELNSGSGEDGTFTVILDPGHGGADPGFISQDNVNEKDINLQLAKRIKSLAPEYNINVLMTRDDDQFMALKDRTQSFSETGYDLFISMHANADNNDSKAGIESYYAENENAATSRLFLDIFRKELSADSYPFVLREEFMKPANFVVLKTNTSPAVLIEAGFLSNEEDMKKLLSDDYATELSKTLLASISKYREQLEGE